MDGWMMMTIIDKKHIDQTLLFKKVDKGFVRRLIASFMVSFFITG
jgi:hypothetical protein